MTDFHLKAETEAALAAALPMLRINDPEDGPSWVRGEATLAFDPGVAVFRGGKIEPGFHANLRILEAHPQYGEIVAAAQPFAVEPSSPAQVFAGEASPLTVPQSVTNFQARAVMRQVPMPDGRSLFTTVDTDLRTAVAQAAQLGEFDPPRIQADLNWQAWEQANEYERHGAITKLLASRYGFDEKTTDDLFRQARDVRA